MVKTLISKGLVLAAGFSAFAEAGLAEETPGGGPVVFQECDACPEMVVVPAGSFTMGSPAGEPGRGLNEGPTRRVVFARPFAMGRTEVTFAQWDACVADGFCREMTNDAGWGRGDRPVIRVSWQAITGEGVDEPGFLAWLNSKVDGAPYRLPSEAEWEYAARAGSQERWSTGDDPSTVDDVAWHRANANGRTQPVGGKQPNAFGLYDMHGNLWEWVQDCGRRSCEGAPGDGSAWMAGDGGDCTHAVLRGGSWDTEVIGLRSAVRDPAPRSHYSRVDGFRVARTLSDRYSANRPDGTGGSDHLRDKAKSYGAHPIRMDRKLLSGHHP